MGTRIIYTTPSGKRMVLLQPGGSSAAITYEGLEGLVGEKKVSTRTTIGIPGEQITESSFGKMKGSLNLVLDTRHGQSIEELESELRRGFLPDQEGTLLVERDRRPRARAKVYLDGFLQPPREVPEGAVDAEYSVPLVSYRGLWTQDTLHGSGSVTVTNTGDTFLWPKIRWRGGSRRLTLPSGLVVTLPSGSLSTWNSLSLDPFTSHEVTNLATGEIDPVASDTAGHALLGEGVPVGASRTYATSSTIFMGLEWAPQIRDPWR